MNEFEEKVMDSFSNVKERLTAIETKIKELPCGSHNEDITGLKISKAYFLGACATVSALVSFVMGLINKG